MRSAFASFVVIAALAAPGLRAAEPGAPAKPTPTAASSWPGTSLFHLEHDWLDQNNKPRRIADYDGRLIVVALIFTNCQYSCPITVAHLKRLDSKLDAPDKKDVQFVLVSLDPTRDTPAVLKAFAKKNDLDDTRWTLLHGDPSDIRELSVALQLRYKETSKGEYAHGRAITILDRHGVIVYQGMTTDEELATIAKGRTPSSR